MGVSTLIPLNYNSFHISVYFFKHLPCCLSSVTLFLKVHSLQPEREQNIIYVQLTQINLAIMTSISEPGT